MKFFFYKYITKLRSKVVNLRVWVEGKVEDMVEGVRHEVGG